MHLSELIIIAIGVSMDAFAVSICKGLSVRSLQPKHACLTALWFGGFQTLMPLIGYFLGVSFADFVSSVDHWIAFVLLGIIGGNMIKESFSKDECDYSPDFSFKTMLSLAVATSIDALAIGVSFAFLRVNICTYYRPHYRSLFGFGSVHRKVFRMQVQVQGGIYRRIHSCCYGIEDSFGTYSLICRY